MAKKAEATVGAEDQPKRLQKEKEKTMRVHTGRNEK